MDLLIWLFLIPFILAALAFIVPAPPPGLFKKSAILLSLIPLLFLLLNHNDWIGSAVRYAWFPSLSIYFYLQVDGLSLLFLYLVTFLVPISLLAVKSGRLHSPGAFYGLVFLLEGLLIGFFLARDLALFTFFWEAVLIPLYFIISFWGGPQRQMAALKFLVYMVAGSCLMVAAVLTLYFAANGSFDMNQLPHIVAGLPYAPWLFLIFVLAFAVKIPLFPFHAWLPDAYYQAPVAGTILLSAILSKAGIYGFFRIGWQIFPVEMQEWAAIPLGLAIAGVFYGGLAAWVQHDFKRLIAYSSFSHVNFILVGIFIWNQVAHEGAVIQALNHGITIAALFLVAGWLENRLQSTVIGKAGGVAKYLPKLCWLTLFFVLSSVALPGMNGFIGEFMILFGLFAHNPWLAAFLGTSVILSVIYMLRWMQLVYFEAPSSVDNSWRDIRGREVALTLPLIVLVLWIGLYPMPVLRLIEGIGVELHSR